MMCACGNPLPFAAYRCFDCATRRVEISDWMAEWSAMWHIIGLLVKDTKK